VKLTVKVLEQSCITLSIEKLRSLSLFIAVGTLCLLWSARGWTQPYPQKTVRIVTAGVGGGSDFVSRVIAQAISGPLGQPVIVDNRPSGVIPGEIASQAAPDGYTLLVASNGLWIEAYLRESTPYDVTKDFAPITLVGRSPAFLVVHPTLPVNSVKELIALAQSRPGDLNYASGAVGGTDHLAAELFKSMARVNIVRVGYKSGAVRTADLIGGHVQLSFGTGGTVAPYVKAGKLRALATTSAQRSVVFPELPTVSEAGVPGYEAVQMLGVFAPARTPPAIIARLNQETTAATRQLDVKARLLGSGVEAVGSSPETFATVIKADMTKWSALIRQTGMRIE
jgi:tripartite-type tricarboxylate transporter receptor subunit TctC